MTYTGCKRRDAPDLYCFVIAARSDEMRIVGRPCYRCHLVSMLFEDSQGGAQSRRGAACASDSRGSSGCDVRRWRCWMRSGRGVCGGRWCGTGCHTRELKMLVQQHSGDATSYSQTTKSDEKGAARNARLRRACSVIGWYLQPRLG